MKELTKLTAKDIEITVSQEEVDGKVYEISLWEKEVNGKEILSASIQEPYKKENKVTNEPPTLKEQKQEDDNLPF